MAKNPVSFSLFIHYTNYKLKETFCLGVLENQEYKDLSAKKGLRMQ